MNNFARRIVEAAAEVVNNASIVLLRAPSLGNNCHFIADNYPGGQLRIITPDQLAAVPNLQHVIRWGTTGARVPRGVKVFNKAEAIKETLNKAVFRKKAADAGLAPKTWLSLEALSNDPVGAEHVIIRPMEHARSEHIYKCSTIEQAEEAIRAITALGQNYYISEYIEKDEEYRVFIVAGKVVICLKKKPADRSAVSWGCVEEGRLEVMRWSQWPMAVVENAVKAFNLSKLDFGAVDVMLKGDKAYFLEINTAPEVWRYYGERLGEAFHYHINRDQRGRLPSSQYRTWQDVAHPTLVDA